MRLAQEIGALHSDYLEEDLSMRQVGEWLDHYNREPWGFEIKDMRNALNCLVTAQGAGAKNVKLEMFKIRPRVAEPARPGYELAGKVRAIFKVPVPRG